MKIVKCITVGRVFDMRRKDYRSSWEFAPITHWDVVDDDGKRLAGGLVGGGFHSDFARFPLKRKAAQWIEQQRYMAERQAVAALRTTAA
jgi:hypothetical protein